LGGSVRGKGSAGLGCGSFAKSFRCNYNRRQRCQYVHLADEREAASIRKNGIKVGKHQQGIFCMPVLQNFYVSHQWLRELKRSGARTYVGVYFKLDSKELVYAGKYNQEHRHISFGEAIKEIMSLEDPLGY